MTTTVASLTARTALRRGLPDNAVTVSPYRYVRGRDPWVHVVAIRPAGTIHAELQAESGKWFLVDLSHQIMRERAS